MKETNITVTENYLKKLKQARGPITMKNATATSSNVNSIILLLDAQYNAMRPPTLDLI